MALKNTNVIVDWNKNWEDLSNNDIVQFLLWMGIPYAMMKYDSAYVSYYKPIYEKYQLENKK